MAGFDDIAERYRQSSLVQASAGAQLIDLLDIAAGSEILDVGCGTGNLTEALLIKGCGRVIGIDPSEAMIREAARSVADPRIRFMVMGDSEMRFENDFDIVFCNSAFQWFRNPAMFLGNTHRALRPEGRIGMQAPARLRYCPAFLDAIESCSENPEIRQVFSGFRSPWFLLESAGEYRTLFEAAGFKVLHCSLREESSRRTPDEVYDIFCSGAKAGYLDPACYDNPFPDGFETGFLHGIRNSFVKMAEADGKLDLVFYRIFVIAGRQTAQPTSP